MPGVESLPPDVLNDIERTFHEVLDLDSNGRLSSGELGKAMEALGESVPGYKLREMIDEVDKDKNGYVEFDEFLEMYANISSKTVFGEWTTLISKRDNLKIKGGKSEASAVGTTHTSSDAEEFAFTDWINSQLKDDPDVQYYLPIAPDERELYEKLKDGIILCKMINLSQRNTIDERAINKGKLNAFMVSENNILALNSASAIGCTVVNVGPQDIKDGTEHLVLGLLWQIIRIGLFANITLSANPNIAVLLEDGESIDDLLRLSPEELLLRWVNYHLRKSNSSRRIYNFSGDIKDSEAYATLLHSIAPHEFLVDRAEKVIRESEMTNRAEVVLKNADKLGCRKFVTAKDICSGNQKLNLAFVANLFNQYPALDPNDMDEQIEYEPYEETREEKTYRNWMNSLGVNPFVYHLYNDLSNGLVLFQLYEDIKQGTVNYAKVNKPPFKVATGGNMKKLENCNYAIEIGKNKNGYSLVGIGGEDIYNGNNKTLVLALIWQMLRNYTVNIILRLRKENDEKLSDKEILDWVNQKLASSGKQTRVQALADPSISTSHVVIDLIDAIKKKSIDYDLVTPGNTNEEKMLNAQYAISMSRKIGARTYALPEDLVEVKQKMVLTVFACLMTRALQNMK